MHMQLIINQCLKALYKPMPITVAAPAKVNMDGQDHPLLFSYTPWVYRVGDVGSFLFYLLTLPSFRGEDVDFCDSLLKIFEESSFIFYLFFLFSSLYFSKIFE